MSDASGGMPLTGQFIREPDGTVLPIVVGPGGEVGVILQGQFVRLQDLPFQAVPFDASVSTEPPIVQQPGGPIGPILPPAPPPPPPAGPQGPPVVRSYDFGWVTYVVLIGVFGILIAIAYLFFGGGGEATNKTATTTAPRYGLNINVSGTVAGQSAQGQVYGPGFLACVVLPQSNTELVQVTWSGRLQDGRQISGEFVGPLGRVDFGTNAANGVGNANISVGTSGRVGGGVQGGTGSLTMDSTKSGSIDAELEVGGLVRVVGNWTCSS